MSSDEKVRAGGLMRCCLATLDEVRTGAKKPVVEGETLQCRYCTSRMIFRNGAWEWDKGHD